MLLLCALVVGSGRVWADTYIIGWGSASGSNCTNFTATSGSVSDLLSFSTAANSASNPAYNEKNHQLRLYCHANSGSGGSITITPALGVTFTGVTITSATNPSISYKVGSGSVTGVPATGTGPYTYTITDISATSSSALTIQNINKSTNVQFQISTIEITYSNASGGNTCSTPSFSPSAGAVPYNTNVEISCATDDATIYYTTDGSTPTIGSASYSGAIAITAATTIKAIAVKDGLENSSIATASYTIAAPSAPTFNVAAGSIAAGTKVSITGTGTIRYTTNGVDPTPSTGNEYSEPIAINADCTLKAICVDGGGNASSVTSETYTVITPVPGYTIDFESVPAAYTDWTMTNIEQGTNDISAHGGTYYGTTGGKASASIVTKAKVANPETLTFYVSKTSNNTTSSTWYVEVSSNGSDWTELTNYSATGMDKGTWEKVERDIYNSAEGEFYTNVYIRIRYDGSTAIRTIDDISLTEVMPVATPEFSVEPGTYTEIQSVEITCGTDGAAIYYTTDGSTPSSSSNLYASAVTIDHSCTLKAIAIKGDDESNIASAAYTINLPTEYNLATTITSGKHYVITSGKTGDVKVMTNQASDYRNTINASVSSDILSASGACEIIIYGPDEDDHYVLYDDVQKGYLYAASTGSNYLRTQTTIDNNARWSIDIDGDGVATIIAQGTNTRNNMRYNYNNGSNPRISCYASSSDMPKVYLYEKDGESEPTETITISAAGWASYSSNNALDFTYSGITAYIAQSSTESSVKLVAVTKVPARTGIIVNGTSASINTVTGAADDVSSNLLKPNLKSAVLAVSTEIASTTYYNYTLAYEAGSPVFKHSTGVGNLAANKAYLQTTVNSAASAPSIIRIVDEENNATSIENIEANEKAVKFIENGQLFIRKNGNTYDTLGRVVK